MTPSDTRPKKSRRATSPLNVIWEYEPETDAQELITRVYEIILAADLSESAVDSEPLGVSE